MDGGLGEEAAQGMDTKFDKLKNNNFSKIYYSRNVIKIYPLNETVTEIAQAGATIFAILSLFIGITIISIGPEHITTIDMTIILQEIPQWIFLILVSIIIYGVVYPYWKGHIDLDDKNIQFQRGFIMQSLYMPTINIRLTSIKTITFNKRRHRIFFEFYSQPSSLKEEFVDITGMEEADLNNLITLLRKVPNTQFIER